MASFPNVWTHRKVAETSPKPCEICCKPSTSVLITPENKDFFYVCPSHIKDKGFATPIIDEAAIAAAKKKKEMDDEIERVKQEFEEKQKKKKEKEAEKKNDKDKEEESSKDNPDESKEEEKKTNEKKKSDTPVSMTQNPILDEEPRVFSLKKAFYQQRLDKKTKTEIAKRNRERLQNPNPFPQVPKGLP